MSDGTREAELVRENEALRRRVVALEAEAERFKTTLYSIGDAIIATDADSRISRMNPVAEKLTGWPEAEARGRRLREVFRIVNEETGAEVESPVERVLREGMVVGLANHTVLIARDGSERPIADSGAPIRDEKGETTGVVLVFRDQTEERAAQRALRESERKFHDAVTYLDEGYYSCTVDGVLHEHNVAFARMLGFESDQDLRGSKLPDFWQEREDRKEYLRVLMSEGVVRNYLINAKTIDGDMLVVMANSHLVKDENGRPVRIEGTFTDFTERRRMEQALDESEERFRALFENAVEAMFLTSPDGRIESANPAACQMFGRTERELVAGGRAAVVDTTDPRLAVLLRERLEKGKIHGELTCLRRDGTKFPGAITSALFRDRDGNQRSSMIIRDITRRKQAETALKESERAKTELLEKLNDAQRMAMVGSWEWDLRTNQVWWSEETYRVFGVSQDFVPSFEANGKFIHPDDFSTYGQTFEQSLQTGAPLDFDFRLVANDGLLKHCQAKGKVVHDDVGQPLRFVGTIMDISERKRMEDRVGHLNLVLQAIRNVNQLIVREKDRETLIRRSCEVLTETRGYHSAWIALYDDSGTYLTGASSGLGGTHGALENRLRCGSLAGCGKALEEPGAHVVRSPETECPGCPTALLHKSQSAIAVRLEHEGYVHGLLVMSMDPGLVDLVEEQSLIEEVADDIAYAIHSLTARQEIESLARFPRENPNPVLRVQHDGRIIYANASSEDLLVEWRCVVGDVLPADLRNVISKAVAENQKTIVDVACNHRVLSVLFVPIPGTDHVNLYGRDVTERERAAEDVRRLNAELEQRVVVRTTELEESNKELEAFSYSVSHDLRAPLRAIDGFTGILADEYGAHLDTEGKRLCSVISQNTKVMSRLIDDLLAFSRLGRAAMSLSPIDMATMASSIYHELTTPESRARIDFLVGAVPPAVADPTLMRQVWMNLLSNAIKFSSGRERAVITVSAERSGGESIYAVQDNGAGFDMQYVGKLFGVFQRLHSSREFEGTGVGLALVQRVIRRHGGRVWAEGETDRGATFHFVLPQRGA
jgi:PAS domain S-box-containing protein